MLPSGNTDIAEIPSGAYVFAKPNRPLSVRPPKIPSTVEPLFTAWCRAQRGVARCEPAWLTPVRDDHRRAGTVHDGRTD